MRVLMGHNYYQLAGGEDECFAAESALLESRGHEVVKYTLSNEAIGDKAGVRTAARAIWNQESHRQLRELIRRTKPDVAHFQNTFPLISPSAYYAVKREGVPVVQSVHNYRLACLSANFYRDGRPCEDCREKWIPWPGVVHNCYRGSRGASGAVAAMLVTHRAIRTWSHMVDVYVALTDFARAKLARQLPVARTVVKPNFVFPDPGVGTGSGGYAVFVGRLSPEKGVETLLEAWRSVGDRLPLRVIGQGPLADRVEQASREIPAVSWLGQLPIEETYGQIGDALLLVLPSGCYETFGRVAIEAFAKGTPVVASDIGAVAEIVRGSESGRLFAAGEAADLCRQVIEMIESDDLGALRQRARRCFEREYTGEANYYQLLNIYALARRRLTSPELAS